MDAGTTDAAAQDAGSQVADAGHADEDAGSSAAEDDAGTTPSCAVNNGGCGNPLYFNCYDYPGYPPSCSHIDECAINNGGCGDATYYSCTNNVGAAPTCANIDDCPSVNPCQNGGSCVDGLGTYSCGCTAGYSGAQCETNACAGVTCNGHGSCSLTSFAPYWQCFCEPYWNGDTCSSCDDNTCDSRTSYFADRYVYCRESISESDAYCTDWMGCYGSIYVNATYGTVTGTAMSVCN